MRIFLVGNCQVEPIRIALSMLLPDCQVDCTMLHLEKEFDPIAVRKRIGNTDLVLTQPANASFGGWSTSSLKEMVGTDKLLTFSNVYFNGLHPDATYLGTRFNRMAGTFGDYQSKLIVAGFLAGLSEAACLELFEGEKFEQIGYLGAYNASLEELARRSAEVDVPFLDEFKVLLSQYPCMLTFNHPTSNVLIDYARKLAKVICERTGTVRSNFPVNPYTVPSFLAQGLVWPIYPAIAAAHVSSKVGSLWFRRDLNTAYPRMLHARDLISREYAVFSAMDRARFEESPQYGAITQIIDVITG